MTDANNDPINYNWWATGGNISANGNELDWMASVPEDIYTIHLEVSDGRGGTASESIDVLVIDPNFHVPGDIIAWYPFTGNAQDISGNNLHGQASGVMESFHLFCQLPWDMMKRSLSPIV